MMLPSRCPYFGTAPPAGIMTLAGWNRALCLPVGKYLGFRLGAGEFIGRVSFFCGCVSCDCAVGTGEGGKASSYAIVAALVLLLTLVTLKLGGIEDECFWCGWFGWVWTGLVNPSFVDETTFLGA